MRSARILPVLLALLPLAAAGGDLDGKAELAFQAYDYNGLETYGFRQTYDLQLKQPINATTTLRIFARADDFAGNNGVGGAQSDFQNRQLQPGAELAVSASRLTISVRTELQKLASDLATARAERTIERTTARAEWRPDRLPVISASAHRYVTEDDVLATNLTDENLALRASYDWRAFRISADGREMRSADLSEGYDRRQSSRGLDLGYGNSLFDGRLSFNVSGSARATDLEEKGLGDTGSSVPTPVAILLASNGIDESPSDNDDRPLAPNPRLIDGDLTTSAGISVGPEGQSFHNIALEVGRLGLEPLEEIRVIVRDERGDLLRIGGGAVQWDVWTSEDGRFWTQVSGATTSFNGPLSLYSVRFERQTKRWIKVVNFGVNVGATLVTEVEAYYYTEIGPGGERTTTRDDYVGLINIAANPVRGLQLSYAGSLTYREQVSSDLADRTSDGIDHMANVRYDFRAPFSVRGAFLSRESTQDDLEDSSTSWSGYVDWTPTERLRVTGELTRQDQTFEGSLYGLETRSLLADAWVLPTLSVQMRAGTQSEEPDFGGGSATRAFLTLTSNARLTRATRLILYGSLQRVSMMEGYTPRFLGAGRDDRVRADVLWRSGRSLGLTASVGWFSGETRSGTTGRLKVEWYPFGDGALVIGGLVDQDVDSTSERETTRAQFVTRWTVNRYAALEVSYTAVLTTLEQVTRDQRTLFATLRLMN